jgi:hypothetical protein
MAESTRTGRAQAAVAAPYRWLPNPKPTVWVIAFDPDDGHVVTQLRTSHPDFGLATGVVETPGRLWLGRIGGAGVCYLDL